MPKRKIVSRDFGDLVPPIPPMPEAPGSSLDAAISCIPAGDLKSQILRAELRKKICEAEKAEIELKKTIKTLIDKKLVKTFINDVIGCCQDFYHSNKNEETLNFLKKIEQIIRNFAEFADLEDKS